MTDVVTIILYAGLVCVGYCVGRLHELHYSQRYLSDVSKQVRQLRADLLENVRDADLAEHEHEEVETRG